MKNNLKEIKTTIIGTVLFIIGTTILVYEYFTVNEIEWTYYILPIALICAGIGFLVSPDEILKSGFGFLNKKIK